MGGGAGTGDGTLRFAGVAALEGIAERCGCGVGKLLTGVEVDEKPACIWSSNPAAVPPMSMSESPTMTPLFCDPAWEGCRDMKAA